MSIPGAGDPHAARKVVGVGIDVADVGRLQAAMQRRSGLSERLFTPSEREHLRSRGPEAAALRFAAKEAVMKALGVGIDSVSFTDIELDATLDSVELRGRAADRAGALGATQVEVATRTEVGPGGKLAVAEVVATR